MTWVSTPQCLQRQLGRLDGWGLEVSGGWAEMTQKLDSIGAVNWNNFMRPLHLAWASSQHGGLKESWTSYMTAQFPKGKSSSKPG